MTAISLSKKSYQKLILHCLKHLSSDCYGLLIGTASHNKFDVTDVIPLSHDTVLNPLISLSFRIIPPVLQKSSGKDTKILGFYENLIVNQMKDRATVSEQAKEICRKIGEVSGLKETLLIEVHSMDKGVKGEGVLEDEVVVEEYISEGGEVSFMEKREESEEERVGIKEMLIKFMQEMIVDLQEHLEDTRKDWRNLIVE